MSHAAALPPPVTIAEYDRFLDADRSDTRYQLIGGEIVAMTNPSIAHAIIVGNLSGPLNAALRPRGCFVTQGDVHVQSREDGLGETKPRPDLLAFCGPVDLRRNFVTNPLAVIEVLSPSTMDVDRGPKLRFYKTALPMLQHIVLVYQDQMRVEHSRRNESGWMAETLTAPGALLRLDSLDVAITLAAIYDAVLPE